MKNKLNSLQWLFNNLKSHFTHDGDLLEAVTMSFELAKERYDKEILIAQELAVSKFIKDKEDKELKRKNDVNDLVKLFENWKPFT